MGLLEMAGQEIVGSPNGILGKEKVTNGTKVRVGIVAKVEKD